MTNGVPLGTAKDVVYRVTSSDPSKTLELDDGTVLKGVVRLENIEGAEFGDKGDRFNNIRDSITKVATTGVSYDSPTVVISFEEVFDRFVFADGVPFGVKLEE